MKNAVITLITLMIILATGCSSVEVDDDYSYKMPPPVKIVPPVPSAKIDTKNLNPLISEFLTTCEIDIKKSTDSINEKNLLFYLQHYNKMNSGGNRYYSLERDTLTKMLNSYSEHPYSECYLINKKGIILFTMFNKDILGKHVDHFSGSPITKLYYTSIKNVSAIQDVSSFPTDKQHDLYFSSPVVSGSDIEGVLIAALDINHLGKKLPAETKIIDSDGLFRFHTNQSLYYQKDIDFSNNLSVINNLQTSTVKTAEGDMSYQRYQYKNIKWFIITRTKNSQSVAKLE